MLERSLLPHPTSRPNGISAILVTLARQPSGALELTYTFHGNPNRIRFPEPATAKRADGLWRHTCCEAFIRVDACTAYHEFNFSPAGLWQVYAFSDYRIGGPMEIATAPSIVCRRQPDRLELQATLAAADLPPGVNLRLGLNVVVEAADGDLSYWALYHAPGKPDFHHPDTFNLELQMPCHSL